MSNKRAKRRKVKHFSCPFCETRLWRSGNPKYHVFYRNARQIRENLQISAKKASFLANQSSTYLDRNAWLEEFFCSTHGTMWLYISRHQQELITYRPATKEDWLQTNRTLDPTNPNPSISEFSYRISRKSYYQGFESHLDNQLKTGQ